MNRKLIGLAILSIATVTLGSCQRSRAFKQDQEYYKDDASYYNKPAAGVTQKVAAMGQPKKRVSILNFWNDTPVRQNDMGLFAADELRRGLYATQRLIIPMDSKVEAKTDDFVHGDEIKVAQLIREGRREGVAAIVIGRVTKVVFRQRGDEVGVLRQMQSLVGVDVEMKLFDVAGGREVIATAKSGEAASNAMVALETSSLQSPEFRSEMTKTAIRNAVSQLVPDVIKAIEKMQWEGHVAKILGNKIYVNAGKQSGLVAGDILKVLTQGDDIYDPSTGAYLGRSRGQLKGTLEIVDFIGTDGAVSETHTGGNFAEGDSVQLY